MSMDSPAQASRRLNRIASALDRARNPSLSKLARAIGEARVALGEVEVVQQEGREGQLAVPEGQALSLLSEWLTAKYRIDSAYRSYADRVRGPWRDSLVDHWYKHAEEERQQAYDLAMKIIGLGGDPNVTVIDVPPCPANLQAFCAVLMDLELAAIDKAHRVIAASGTMRSLGVLAENIMLTDTQHLDDLRRMCVQVSA